jgi:hypothetical protein
MVKSSFSVCTGPDANRTLNASPHPFANNKQTVARY